MTFGEKLREARKAAKLTQEELASKLSVSRQAITKWESGRGMPDVENLKAISAALDVSIDYLLDDGTKLDLNVIREPINKEDYELEKAGPLRKKYAWKQVAVRAKYPDAEIHPLIANQILTKSEAVIDNAIWLLGDLAPGTIDLMHELNNMDKSFYLVRQGEKNRLVLVTNDFIESRELTQPIEKGKFKACGFKFTVCKYEC